MIKMKQAWLVYRVVYTDEGSAINQVTPECVFHGENADKRANEYRSMRQEESGNSQIQFIVSSVSVD